MAYAADGTWIPEDASVSSRVAKLQGEDSALIRNAQAGAQRAASRRGLGNSSVAAGAGQAAALGVVVPIASQDAAQVNQANLQFSGDQNQRVISAAQIAASDRANLASSLSQSAATFQSGIANTLDNPKLPAATRAAVQADFATLFQRQNSAFESIYGIKLPWGAAAGG